MSEDETSIHLSPIMIGGVCLELEMTKEREDLSSHNVLAEVRKPEAQDALEVEEPDDVTPGSVIRDHVILSIAFTFVFTAYKAIQNLQTSINKEVNVGLTSLISIYSTFVIFCSLAPIAVSKFGVKLTLVFGWIGHTLYTFANFYPVMATMLPASVILGIVSGPLWTAQGIYVTTKSLKYAKITASKTSVSLAKFNGIFWSFCQTTQITGNAISSLILHKDAVPPSDNATLENSLKFCGRRACPLYANASNQTLTTTLNPVPFSTIQILMGVFASLDVCGLGITIILLKPLKKTIKGNVKQHIRSFAAQFCNLHVLLLLPLYVFNGFEQAFAFGEFTKSYITCSVGAREVGFIMVTYGVCDAITCVLIGPLTDYVSRAAQLFFITCGHTGVIVYLLFWQAEGTSVIILYVVAGAWGVCDAFWQTQTNAYIGEILADCADAAFAVLNAFRSLGFALAFATSTVLCTNVKLYALEGLMLVSILMYGISELRHRKAQKSEALESSKL